MWSFSSMMGTPVQRNSLPRCGFKQGGGKEVSGDGNQLRSSDLVAALSILAPGQHLILAV